MSELVVHLVKAADDLLGDIAVTQRVITHARAGRKLHATSKSLDFVENEAKESQILPHVQPCQVRSYRAPSVDVYA
jgi:hypothetical protein